MESLNEAWESNPEISLKEAFNPQLLRISPQEPLKWSGFNTQGKSELSLKVRNEDEPKNGFWESVMYRKHPQFAIIKSKYPNVTWSKSLFESNTEDDYTDKTRKVLTWVDFYDIMKDFDSYGDGPSKLATFSDPDMVIDIYESIYIIDGPQIKDRDDESFRKIDNALWLSIRYGNVKVSNYLYNVLKPHDDPCIDQSLKLTFKPGFESEEIISWAIETAPHLKNCLS